MHRLPSCRASGLAREPSARLAAAGPHLCSEKEEARGEEQERVREPNSNRWW